MGGCLQVAATFLFIFKHIVSQSLFCVAGDGFYCDMCPHYIQLFKVRFKNYWKLG